ncbi:MAG TPA: FAD-binding oxidoreductase [Gemmatimonadaceae bacterium]|nr:FAD-binding oxidoreductase [Gemmatimonadaceae bacterium]
MTLAARAHDDVPGTIMEVADLMRDAMRTGEPMRICGGGTWHSCGAPVTATRTLSLRALSGIVGYVPGDLTLTALAGTSLAELAHVTAAHGQWLGIDPAGSRHGTIGATIATASAGPLSHAFGTPRDLVLGVEAVTGYGERVAPGGRVVKNVAGFDLVRLYTGSWGTLGPIMSVSLRLRALPVHDVTFALTVDGPGHLGTLTSALRASTVSLLACEWLDGRSARSFGAGDGNDVVLVRLGGNDAFIRGQQARLEAVAQCTPCDPAVWGRLATLDDDAHSVVRFSGAIASLPQRIERLRDAAGAAAASVSMHATIARGVVRVIVHEGGGDVRDSLTGSSFGEQRIAERLPVDWWRTEHDPFETGLAGRIRAAFDPARLCNRRRSFDA